MFSNNTKHKHLTGQSNLDIQIPSKRIYMIKIKFNYQNQAKKIFILMNEMQISGIKSMQNKAGCN